MSDVDLQVAVMVGDRRDVKKYIDAGGDLEIKDEDGATALFHAAFWTHVDVAKDLIGAGANINAQRNDGFTPLHVAVKNNQPRMTEVLVDAMADLTIKEEFGDTPLHWAYRSKSTECIEILLAAGADPKTVNHMGKVPSDCEGTGVDRQEEGDDFEDDDGARLSPGMSEANSAGDASTVIGDPADREDAPIKSPSRPNEGRSGAARSNPRTNRTRSDARSDASLMGSKDYHRARFRMSYPPNIKGGGKWHSITAFLFEPSAHRAVKQIYQARVSGDRRPSESDGFIDDCDRTIPPGTEVVIRPRFPRVRVRYSEPVHRAERP